MAVTMSKVQTKSVEGERKRLEQAREIAKSEKRLNVKVTLGSLALSREQYTIKRWLPISELLTILSHFKLKGVYAVTVKWLPF